MNKNMLKIGDYVRIEEYIYEIVTMHSEIAHCINVDSGFKTFIDYNEMEEIVNYQMQL